MEKQTEKQEEKPMKKLMKKPMKKPMKKCMNRLLAVMLALVLAMAGMPFEGLVLKASAEGEPGKPTVLHSGTCGAEEGESNLTWELYDNGTLVVLGAGEMKNYSDGHPPWQSVWPHPPWYNYRGKVTSIIIEKGVTSIGDGSFECYNDSNSKGPVASVTIPDTVQCIGAHAFCAISNNLTSITIPESVTSIGRYAFADTELTSVTIPGSVKEANYAFVSCENLTSATIQEGITTIWKGLFYGCNNLPSVTIPESVTSIEDEAFGYCRSLEAIEIPKGVKSIGEKAFCCCNSLKSIEIPKGVKSIGKKAFYNCYDNGAGLKSATIAGGAIGEEAFANCYALNSVTILEDVNSIQKSAFQGCTALGQLTISDEGVKCTIEESAFESCVLTSVTIPERVTFIDNNAFKNCKNLTSVTIEGTPYISPSAFEGCDNLIEVNAQEGVGAAGKYTVSFDSMGGTPTPTAQLVRSGHKATKPAEPTREGYTFDGWYVEAEDGSHDEEFDFDNEYITSNIRIYARWTSTATPPETTYDVSFDAGGGTGTMGTETIAAGAVLTLPENGFTAPKGRQFKCWAIGKADGRQVSAGYQFTVSEDTVIYAIWEDMPPQVYTVTYDANGGTGLMDHDTVEEGKTVRLPANGFTAPEGRRFVCWAVGKTEGTKVYAGYPYTFTEDTTVYALWEDIPTPPPAPVPVYTVTFDTDGGSRVAAQEVEEGKTLAKPEAPAKEGYTFAGWYSDAECTAEFDFSTPVTKNATIYAKWEEIPVVPPAPVATYTVTYDANGGTGLMDHDTVEEGKVMRLPANEFTAPDGRRFKCWAVGSVDGVTKGAGSKYTFRADTKVYAIWETVIPVSDAVPLKKTRFTGFKGTIAYSSKEVTQDDMKLTYNGETLVESMDGGISGDYIVSYINNIDAGKATVRFTGVNNYTGTVQKTYKIVPYNMAADTEKRLCLDPEEITVSYVKGGARPSVKLYDGDILLTEGKDYTLSYKNNTVVKKSSDSKAPTIIIKGKGNYKGTLKEKKIFTITAKDLSEVTIAAKDVKASTKKGKYKSVPDLTDTNGKKLKAGTDYSTAYVYTYKNDSAVINRGEEVTRDAGEIVDANDIVPAGTVLCVTVSPKEKSNYEGTPITAEYSIY